MKYIVNGKRKFATMQEALDYAASIYRRTGNIVAVEAI
jgi:hypothetical protein